MKSIALLACFTLTLVVSSNANPLEKRHQFELRLGMWNQTTEVRTEIIFTNVSTSVRASGFLAGLSYGYWLTESQALNVSIGAMLADVRSNEGVLEVSSRVSTVTSILMGMKQYFPSSTYGTAVRPYAKASIGTFIGSQTRTDIYLVVTVESRTETAIGGQVGAGVDFVVSRPFMIGIALGYNLMTDFNEPIGGSKNYSGPELSFGFSYLFGKGTRQ